MTMFSIGPFASFFGRKNPPASSPQELAAWRVYRTAEDMGDATSALEVANTYGLTLTAVMLRQLSTMVATKCSDECMKGRHMLALADAWAKVIGAEPLPALVEEALKCDPSLLLRAALLSGISSIYRAQLIKRILATGDITPADLYQAFRLLSMRERTQFAERCVEYALSKNDIENAYEIARWAIPATRGCLSEEVRTRLIQALLSSPADTVGKRTDHLKWATNIA